MKTIKAIKENPKLEIKQTSIDGLFGILHMTGLRHCTVIASWGGGWEHVSVCPENRTPNWDEMCKIKDMFWNDDEVARFLSEFSACNICEQFDKRLDRCGADNHFVCVKEYAQAIIGDWLKQPVEE